LSFPTIEDVLDILLEDVLDNSLEAVLWLASLASMVQKVGFKENQNLYESTSQIGGSSLLDLPAGGHEKY
jgi:hypothetical protein